METVVCNVPAYSLAKQAHPYTFPSNTGKGAFEQMTDSFGRSVQGTMMNEKYEMSNGTSNRGPVVAFQNTLCESSKFGSNHRVGDETVKITVAATEQLANIRFQVEIRSLESGNPDAAYPTWHEKSLLASENISGVPLPDLYFVTEGGKKARVTFVPYMGNHRDDYCEIVKRFSGVSKRKAANMVDRFDFDALDNVKSDRTFYGYGQKTVTLKEAVVQAVTASMLHGVTPYVLANTINVLGWDVTARPDLRGGVTVEGSAGTVEGVIGNLSNVTLNGTETVETSLHGEGYHPHLIPTAKVIARIADAGSPDVR